MKTETGDVELKDGNIYYEVAGEGETLLLSHAGFVDSGMWDDQWKPFAEKYHVIRYDMRGYGKSSKLDHPVCRRDDLAALLNHLKVEKAHLLGCSMGGEIVIDFTLEYPERVISLIPVSAVPSGFQMQGQPPQELMEMIQAAQNGDLKRESELQMRVWIDGPFRHPEQVDMNVRERAAKMNKIPVQNATFMKADAQPSPNPLNPPAIQQLDTIKVPTLIIAGALDNSEIVRGADVMQKGIPHAKKLIIEGTAHMPNMEKPTEFNKAVLDFLSAQ